MAGVPVVMKCKKSLYGLRLSPKNWCVKMDQCLGDIGFRPLMSNPCVHVYGDEVGFVILTLYVDDLLLLGANQGFTRTAKISTGRDGGKIDC